MIEVKLPELGESIETAEVSRLLVGEGDTVKAGQNVLELESDKASFPLPCASGGRVSKIHVKPGDTVTVGQTVLEIEEGGNGEPKKAEPAPKAKDEPQTQEGKKPVADERKPEKANKENELAEESEEKGDEAEVGQKPPSAAGPSTRRLARELGINLADVQGSERGGRITREDIKVFVKERLAQADAGASAPDGGHVPPLPDFSRFGPVKRQPLNKIARTSAARLSLAWRVAPHVTQHGFADITELDASRLRFNDDNRDNGPKLTMTVLAMQAAVIALKAYPHFNSSYDASAQELIVKEYYRIGIAVDTEQGLLVPVVHDADRKTLVELANELTELAERARSRALGVKDMEGGTFTITNLGGIGGTFFTPIINYPEVAILGLGRADWQLRRTRKTANRLMLPLSLSYDHRVINGADGARFLARIADLLSSPFQLLSEMHA